MHCVYIILFFFLASISPPTCDAYLHQLVTKISLQQKGKLTHQGNARNHQSSLQASQRASAAAHDGMPASNARNKQSRRELDPLLDEKLIKEIIFSWSRPLPDEYLKQPLVLVGPSAVGKNRLVTKLMKDYSKFFRKCITHTTRLPRADETNGTTYHFVTRDAFSQLVDRGDFFVEHSEVHNNCYGLSAGSLEEARGKIPILELDVQGARKLRHGGVAERYGLQPKYLFIAPTSIDALKERLVLRGTETEEEMALRLRNAEVEIHASAHETGLFDIVLVNDDLEATSRALFNTCRFWYPMLPSPSRLRMLQRRVAKVKAQAAAQRGDGDL